MSGSSLAALNWKILKISSVQSLKSAQSLRGVPSSSQMTAIGYHFTSSTTSSSPSSGAAASTSVITDRIDCAQPLGRPRGERLSDEAPESSVLLAVDAQDALADPVPELALGDALRGEGETRGSEVATIANHRLGGLVAQRLDAERPSRKRTSCERVTQQSVRIRLGTPR